MAWAGHIPFAYWLIQSLKPQTFVELGTHTGNSYLAFCQSISNYMTGTKAFAIDTWTGDEHSGVYGGDVFLEVETRNQKYSSFSTLIRSTFDEALNSFSDKSIDLLHIDGLHTYEAVKHDFDSWLPKMSPGGVVLFHDIKVFERGFGVHHLWDRVSREFQSFEFRHSHGLGIIQLPGNSSSIIEPLQNNEHAARSLFSKLGEALIISKELEMKILYSKELENDISKLNLANQVLGDQLEQIINSKSWQYTRLFRNSLGLLKGRNRDK